MTASIVMYRSKATRPDAHHRVTDGAHRRPPNRLAHRVQMGGTPPLFRFARAVMVCCHYANAHHPSMNSEGPCCVAGATLLEFLRRLLLLVLTRRGVERFDRLPLRPLSKATAAKISTHGVFAPEQVLFAIGEAGPLFRFPFAAAERPTAAGMSFTRFLGQFQGTPAFGGAA